MPDRRAKFAPEDISILQTLADSVGYSPSPAQMREVQLRTPSMTVKQIRNWFENKRRDQRKLRSKKGD
jgi:hypothetical protein